MEIQFPEYNGLEIAHTLIELPVSVIFLCEDPGYALEAYKVSPVTYLLKSPSVVKVKEALAIWRRRNSKYKYYRLFKRLAFELVDDAAGEKKLKRILLPTLNSVQIIDLSKLLTLEAKSNYTVFSLSDQRSFVSSKNLKVYDDMLSEHPFFLRIGRSYIVNKEHIREIKRTSERKFKVVLDNGKELTLSSRQKEILLQKLVS